MTADTAKPSPEALAEQESKNAFLQRLNDLSQEMIEQVAAFAAAHYRPEPKRKRRKPSFEGGAAVQQMASEEKGTP